MIIKKNKKKTSIWRERKSFASVGRGFLTAIMLNHGFGIRLGSVLIKRSSGCSGDIHGRKVQSVSIVSLLMIKSVRVSFVLEIIRRNYGYH